MIARNYPDDRSYVNFGITLAQAGQFGPAEQYLRRTLALKPNKVQAHYFLCLVLYHKAEKLDKDPSHRSEQVLGLYREAVKHAREAVRLKPDHGFGHVYLGLALQVLGEDQNAIDSLRQGVRCRPELADPHLHLGKALTKIGKWKEARQELTLAKELAAPSDPRPTEALKALQRKEKSHP